MIERILRHCGLWPGTRLLCNIRWLEDIEEGIVYEVQDMCGSLAEALKARETARTGPKPAQAAAG
ncbi:MAG: hypothetical protein ABR915_22180 [Thermoguttaceae bacterium]